MPGLSGSDTTRTSLQLPSTAASVDVVEQRVQELARHLNFTEDEVADIGLAVREAAANAVFHGHGGDPARLFHCTIDSAPRELVITLCDSGSGFSADEVPDPLAEENRMRGSGRGLLMMRALMDSVEFRPLHPGTEVVLRKRCRNCAGPIP